MKLIKIYKIQLRENNMNYDVGVVNLINIFNRFKRKLCFHSKMNIIIDVETLILDFLIIKCIPSKGFNFLFFYYYFLYCIENIHL